MNSLPIEYATDTLMCLRSDALATKTHKWVNGAWATTSYGAGFRFDAYSSPPIQGVRGLSDLLRKLETYPDWFVIRGRLKIGEDRAKRVLRRMHDREGEQADFIRQDRRWVCIDIDGAPGPWGDDLEIRDQSDLDNIAEWACEAYLPEPFRGVDVHYQWSSSAGLVGWGSISLHLWFWLD